jgi:basic membrane lipoprotein Med (substrate-binding protein (PBP1-ABC) superfamily)
MGVIKRMKKNLDYEGKGGAMFLGLKKAVVKGHGNSKARAFSASIEQAINAVRGDMVGKMEEMTVRYEVRPTGVYKKPEGGMYEKIEGEELENFRRAARGYLKLVKTKLYC